MLPSKHAGRRRIVLPLAAVSVVATLLLGGTASAAPRYSRPASPVVSGSRYLALGDSITFGYEEPQVVPAPNYKHASSFLGYPELLGSALHLIVANAACPGETSSSLINPAAPSNGCENVPGHPHVGYHLLGPLHVHYAGSQLRFALSYLRTHQNVRLVSLMIGANDLLLCQETSKDACTRTSEQQAVYTTVARNVRYILSAIRNRAHYRGQLAIVNYYSPVIAFNSYIVRLNQAVDAAAKPFSVVVANGFGEFQAADSHSGGNPCTAGLLTQLGSPGNCGIHPSYAGQALLARALLKVITL